MHRFYGYLCHQGENLNLFNHNIVLPLCFRCLGIHIFLFTGGWIYEFFIYKTKHRISAWFLVVGTLPMIIDGIFNISKSVNCDFLAFISGSLFGFTCSIIILQGISK
ncbi:MAG: DUF2085 domain-containing protein [Bacteroidales bacterium]|nr:DUF2085 domain-containing protein [Bacteroidales bacterium]